MMDISNIEYIKELKDIKNMFLELKTHVINMIIPFSEINQALKTPGYLKRIEDISNKPLTIDDRDLQSLLIEFKKSMGEFKECIEASKTASAFREFAQTLHDLKSMKWNIEQMQSMILELKQSEYEKRFKIKFFLEESNDKIPVVNKIDSNKWFCRDWYIEIDTYDISNRCLNAIGEIPVEKVLTYELKDFKSLRAIGRKSIPEIDIFRKRLAAHIGFPIPADLIAPINKTKTRGLRMRTLV